MTEIPTCPDIYEGGLEFDKPREMCGIFAIFDTKLNVALAAFDAANAQQHRGQECAGITVSDGQEIRRHVGRGRVDTVFRDEAIFNTELGLGCIASSHVRYGTLGAEELNPDLAAQPTIEREAGFTLAHNGHFFVESKDGLTDSKIVSMMIADRMKQYGEDTEEAVRGVLSRVEGAYSLAITTKDKVIAVRDPRSFRPLNLAKTPNGYAVASEEPALIDVGGTPLREVEPGEMLIIDKNGLRSEYPFPEEEPSLCIMEMVYLADPSGSLQGKEIYNIRKETGRLLAVQDQKLHPDMEVDVVCSVPDSGNPAAIGYAAEMGVEYTVAFQKNRYIGRTFIDPGNTLSKEKRIGLKLKVIKSQVEGKNVLVVDDSLIKSNTARVIVKMLKEAGARSVHMRIASDRYKHPCHMGLDTGNTEHLIAANEPLEGIQRKINVNTLEYLHIDDLREAVGETPGLCDACMTGDYPIEVPVSISGKE